MIRKKIKKILVPLDGSKNSLRGLDNAISTARAFQATITGIYVLPVYPRNLVDIVIPFLFHPERKAKKFLADAKKSAAQKGILFKSKIIWGSPISEIQEMINSKKFDLIVLGSRGMGSLKELFLGSVSNAIVHKSKIPVMVVK